MVRLRVLGAIDLRHSDGSAIDAVLRQPKRTALLTYLAISPGNLPRRRDVIVAMFWPEADAGRARDNLSAALGFLRRSLGSGVLPRRGEEEIACDPLRLSSDAADFLLAIEERRDAEALELYAGDLLEGLHIRGAPGFDEWLERERARLRALAAAAATRLADRAGYEGSVDVAASYMGRAAELAPDDEGIVRRLIALRLAAGDRAGALRTFEAFAARLADEFEAEPSEATMALVASVREPSAERQPRSGADDIVPPSECADAVPRERRAVGLSDADPVAAPTLLTATTHVRRRGRWSLAVSAGLAVTLGIALVASTSREVIDAPGDDFPLVVVADLAADDTLLGVTAGAWLRSMLGRSPGVRSLEGARLADALRRMRRDPMLPLDERVARELAVREGAEGLVTGRLTDVDSGYAISVELVRSDGRVIARPGVTAAGVGEMMSALGEQVLRHTATSELPRAADLRPVTTTSLAALVAYTEGERLRYHALDPRAAIPYYERAIRLDSAFAMAYSQLGGAWNALGSLAPPDTVVKLWRSSTRFLDGLTPHETVEIQDRLIFSTPGDQSTKFDRAVRLYQDYLRLHPDDGDALQDLSWYLKKVDRWAESEVPVLHAVRTGYDTPGVYDELVRAQIAIGKFAQADSALRDWRERHGPSQLWYLDAFKLAAARRDYAATDSLTARALRDRTWSVQPGALPFYTLAIRGRMREAEALSAAALAEMERRSNLGPLLRHGGWVAVVRAGTTGDTAGALAALHAVLRRYPPATLSRSTQTHIYKDVGRALAILGDTAGARAMLESLQSNWYIYRWDYMLRGLIHHAAGRWDEAIRELREVRFTAGHLPPLGQAYEAVGQIDSAIVVYERFLNHADVDYPAWDAVFLADVLERLGAIYASRGRHDLAAARYGLLAELWREADPELRWRAERATRASHVR